MIHLAFMMIMTRIQGSRAPQADKPERRLPAPAHVGTTATARGPGDGVSR